MPSPSDLAAAIGAEYFCPEGATEAIEITGIGPLETAQASDLSFLGSSAYEKHLSSSAAGAIIVPERFIHLARPQLVHKNPYYAFGKASEILLQAQHCFRGISQQAHIASDADIGDHVTVFPFAYIGPGVRVGAGSVIYSGVYLGQGVQVGEKSVLRANVVVESGCFIGSRVLIHANTVIGADGFGFARGEKDIAKIPQIGKVVIEDDVEIGPSSTIDRATMGTTRIGRGCKFDSQVHVAHNCDVDEYCLFSAQTGLAGSTMVGKRVTTGGNVGFSGHLSVADDVILGAKAGVTRTLTEAGTYMGFPILPAQLWRRSQIHFKKLDEYEKRLRALEKQLKSDSSENCS